MTTGLYDAVSSMAAAEKRLDVIAQNIANSSAQGFKRQVGTVNSFETIVNGEVRRGQGLRTEIDFAQGEIIETSNSLDLALLGDAFFTFEAEDDVKYSRDGSLVMTGEGQLVSRQGVPVVWETQGGDINPDGGMLRFDSAGFVFQGEESLGQLRIVNFEKPERLAQDEEGYFHAPSSLEPEAHTATVISGAFEAANVNPVHEMVEMIMAQRAYQAASNTVSQLSESYSRLISAR